MNNELLTVEEFEKMCDSFDPNAPTFDYLKAVENLVWLAWPNSRNYTIWLVEKNPEITPQNPRKWVRGASKFIHFDTRREFDRIKYAIEDLYKRLENGKELKEPGVRNMSSVVDDVKNPSGRIHVAAADEAPTKAGESLASSGQIVTNGQDFRG